MTPFLDRPTASLRSFVNCILEVTRVLLADGVSVTSEESKRKVVYVTITTRIAMSKEIHQRTEDWLKVRLNLNSIVLNFDTEGQPLSVKDGNPKD